MAPSYAADHVGPFFSVAFEAEVGKKKPRPSRWRNCGGYSKSCCPGGRIGLPTSWRLSPGGSGAITGPICPRKNGERPKAKASAFRRAPSGGHQSRPPMRLCFVRFTASPTQRGRAHHGRHPGVERSCYEAPFVYPVPVSGGNACVRGRAALPRCLHPPAGTDSAGECPRRPTVADRHLSWMQQPNGAQCPPCLSGGGVGLPQGEVIGPAPCPPCRLVDGA